MLKNSLLPEHYLNLPTRGKVKVEYVWISVSGQTLQSKTRTLDFEPETVDEVPIWNYLSGRETILRPVALYDDPFRLKPHKMVFCETLDRKLEPSSTNTRSRCNEVMEAIADDHPWFGMEQEYYLLDKDNRPLGWPKDDFPAPQTCPNTGLRIYNCANGTGKTAGRMISECHYAACLYSGLEIGGTNAESLIGQWEYQIGTVEGIQIGDQIWMSRFLLHRVAEQFDTVVSFDPKLVPGMPSTFYKSSNLGDWSSAGCHCNFSTESMRNPGGISVILDACQKLSKVHFEHMAYYDASEGLDNIRRLTGGKSSPPIDQCIVGISERNASVRVRLMSEKNGSGYLEDRRPAANCDPYLVAEAIVKTTCLGRKLSRVFDYESVQKALKKIELDESAEILCPVDGS